MYGDALTTKSEIKSRLGITVTTYDTLLDKLILAVTARIQTMTGRSFTSATHSNELHDGSDPQGSLRSTLIVKNAPITTLTSIEYKTGSNTSPTWVAYSAEDYDVDLTGGIVYIKGALPRGKQNIRVTYVGGWTAGQLPSEVVEVCEAVVVRIFKRREAEGRTSESFQESSITWTEGVFSKEDLATVRNYRRGYFV